MRIGLELGWESPLLSLLVPLLYPGVGTHSVEVAEEELTRLILLTLNKITDKFYQLFIEIKLFSWSK